jgi:PAS domain S-box-containing protein
MVEKRVLERSFAELKKTQEQLQSAQNSIAEAKQESEYAQSILKLFLDHNPALSFVKDDKGKYIYVSRSFLKFFKMNEKDILGKTDFEWLKEDIARQFIDNDNRVRATGKSLETIEIVEIPGGAIRSLVHKFPIVEPSGAQLIGGIAIDITERLRLQELQAELAAIVDSSRDAIIGVNKDGIIRTWNVGAKSMLGYTPEEVIGLNLDTVVMNERASEPLQALLEKGELEQIETAWTTKNGHHIHVSIVVSPIHPEEGKLTGFSVVARDITTRIEMENALRAATDEISLARDQALEASALKSTFVSNISHELRTPLAGILGMLELLLSTDLTEEQRPLAKTIEECATKLLAMVNDVLDLSKIEAGKMNAEVEPFNLIYLVQQCSRLMASAARDKQLIFTTTIDDRIPNFVRGDQKRVRQTLLNITGNAIKFTEFGAVNVEVTLEEEAGQAIVVRFSVGDTGIGIAEEKQRLLFQSFSQVDSSSTRKYPGTGLGLYISKQLVDLMGGTMNLQSKKGQGTLCSFTVPFKAYGKSSQ